ncbi:MAG: phosphotransferase family protein [Microthrixaceae bacterium]
MNPRDDTAQATDQLDWPNLEAWLRGHIPELDGDMEVAQFTGGHANLTYCVSFGDQDLVVRRPPFGEIPRGAHDMAREHRVLSGLNPVFDRAPKALGFCDDESIIGAPFLVVERRTGVVIRGAIPDSLGHLPDVEQRLSAALVDALAEFHGVEPGEAGLDRLGRPEGFLDRQLAGWHDRWQQAAPEPMPVFDAVHARLVAARPGRSRTSLVHNDFKFDNCMFAPGDPDRVTSIFDWDMATLGDPLIDLGTVLSYWKDPDDEIERSPTVDLDMTGFATRAEVIERYAAAGHCVDHIDWYEAFATWKLAVVLQQLFNRFVAGHTEDDRLGRLGQHVLPLAEHAHDMLAARPRG